MPKQRQEERDDALPQDKGFANEDDVHPSDRAVLGITGEDESRDEADREPDTLADDDAVTMDVGTEPRSEETSADYDNDDQETLDGLDELEESVREQAEDRSLGDRNGFDT